MFEGTGDWIHSGEIRPFNSDPTSGVRQNCKEMTADFKGYPVGSIYLTWENTNPQSFMGGTWVRMAEGRSLFGIGASKGRDGYTRTVTEHEEFGSWKHTLSVAELPAHAHTRGTYTCDHEASGYGLQLGSVGFANRVMVSGSGDTGKTGSGNSFYIVPPYIGIYVWRRTA